MPSIQGQTDGTHCLSCDLRDVSPAITDRGVAYENSAAGTAASLAVGRSHCNPGDRSGLIATQFTD